MLKSEFERLIGKEVDYETFEKYNDIYMCLPDYTKEEFVDILDISKIPESQEAIERKQHSLKMIESYKEEINSIKQDIKRAKEDIARYSEYYADDGDNYWITQISYIKDRIKRYKAQITTLEYAKGLYRSDI